MRVYVISLHARQSVVGPSNLQYRRQDWTGFKRWHRRFSFVVQEYVYCLSIRVQNTITNR